MILQRAGSLLCAWYNLLRAFGVPAKPHYLPGAGRPAHNLISILANVHSNVYSGPQRRRRMLERVLAICA